MNIGQYEGLMARLGEIRDRLPVGDVSPDNPISALVGNSDTREADKLAGAVNALAAMARTARGWAEGAYENAQAMGHRDVRAPEDQVFFLPDILNMVDDAAREIGVTTTYGTVRSS
jgi:hypothetical protein